MRDSQSEEMDRQIAKLIAKRQRSNTEEIRLAEKLAREANGEFDFHVTYHFAGWSTTALRTAGSAEEVFQQLREEATKEPLLPIYDVNYKKNRLIGVNTIQHIEINPAP